VVVGDGLVPTDGDERRELIARNEPEPTEETRREKGPDEWNQFRRSAPPTPPRLSCCRARDSCFCFWWASRHNCSSSAYSCVLPCPAAFCTVPPPPNKTISVALSPQANYTDRSAVTCRRTYCQFFWVEGCRVVSAADPPRSLISVF
jgi:hypothetical protein